MIFDQKLKITLCKSLGPVRPIEKIHSPLKIQKLQGPVLFANIENFPGTSAEGGGHCVKILPAQKTLCLMDLK